MSATGREVGIIMRARDEMPYPPRALEALQAQSFQDFNLHVVDSGSTDGTLEVLEAARPFQLIRIAPGDYVPGKVLNRMVAGSREPIVCFLNADAIPMGGDCLEKLLEPIRAGRADATMSKQVARPDAHFIVDYDYRRAYDPKNIKGENADFFSAVCCAFRRELWEQTRFYEEGYAEDLVWAARCRQKGARFELVLDSVVEHSHNYSLPGLRKKKFRHGVVFARLYGQKPDALRQVLACARESARDGLEALRRGRWTTVPYNLRYRATIHRALWEGLRQGAGEPPLIGETG